MRLAQRTHPLSDLLVLYFFFQAEDGIRDIGVTGVQTCALPISDRHPLARRTPALPGVGGPQPGRGSLDHADRKSTRLNSSHANISYAVFCLKKKKKNAADVVEASADQNFPLRLHSDSKHLTVRT